MKSHELGNGNEFAETLLPKVPMGLKPAAVDKSGKMVSDLTL
jgi:hypothetical protein